MAAKVTPKRFTQSDVDEQPLLMRFSQLAGLYGVSRQRIYELHRTGLLGLEVFDIRGTMRVSTIEALRSLGYSTTELERRLFAKPMLNETDLRHLLGLATQTVKAVIEESGITVVRAGIHQRYPARGLASWLGVKPDHDARTPASTSRGEPGISSCVKTKRGKLIQPGKPYRFSGKVYDGSDVIVIARALGVA
ncbi:hypothetical protein ACIO14_14920 [Nocardia fluminea]|uniref:hypothetical protein n=1 Tax=Nocardia fluminea TaxID=134984 RepID=UPI0037FAF977